ncbi:hypothetical protein ERJ75_001392500 [Trypanosoma vivax]|nr:hypothetical protein ERJ75_001392500 [Trypanosoma vivax]
MGTVTELASTLTSMHAKLAAAVTAACRNAQNGLLCMGPEKQKDEHKRLARQLAEAKKQRESRATKALSTIQTGTEEVDSNSGTASATSEGDDEIESTDTEQATQCEKVPMAEQAHTPTLAKQIVTLTLAANMR